MDQLRGITAKKAILGLAAVIVAGGFLVALSSFSFGLFGSFTASPASLNGLQGTIVLGNNGSISPANGNPYSSVVGVTQTYTATTTVASSSTTGYGVPQQPGTTVSQGSPAGAGGLIEFSTDLGIRTASPEHTAAAISALAYSVGGYVAYQTTYSNSAYVVIRVPAAEYQKVLLQVKAMGDFVSETSNSNDVRVQYTDLNATLASLKTEQGALLKLLNQSTTVNSTLAIETQLQQVNQQINEIESQILQTRTLIDYATINVTVTQTAQQTLPTMSLSASPRGGTSPLSVTFNAIVKGGAPPYIINYNFGDGSASQGQIIIHTFYEAGDYNVTVNVTDQGGNTTSAWTMVHVVAAPAQSGISTFFGNVSGLFVNVIEGIIEVAVVVLPLAAVGAAIIIPIQRRSRSQKGVRQSQ